MIKDVVSHVKAVGDFIRNEFNNFDVEKVEHKGFNDLVSYVDKEAERKIIEGLYKLLPGASFLAEEEAIIDESSDTFWIIDPLDGTTNFIHGLPVFAISVALYQKGSLKLGVVYEINRDECFYAVEGEGAYMNGKPIQVSDVEQLSGSLLATGFPYYDFGKMPQYLKILNSFMETTHGLRRMGAAAVDLAYVAAGRFEGFFEYNLKPWDVAAGALIVREAGGLVSDFSGNDDFLFKGEIIAACKVHGDMQNIISGLWKN